MKDFFWISTIIIMIAGVCGLGWIMYIEGYPLVDILIAEIIWVITMYFISTWFEDGEQ